MGVEITSSCKVGNIAGPFFRQISKGTETGVGESSGEEEGHRKGSHARFFSSFFPLILRIRVSKEIHRMTEIRILLVAAKLGVRGLDECE